MRTKAEILADIAAKRDALKALYDAARADKRSNLNAEEEAKATAIEAEIEGFQRELKRREDMEAFERSQDAKNGGNGGGAPAITPNPQGRAIPETQDDGQRGRNPRVEVIPNGREHLPFASQADFFRAVYEKGVNHRHDDRFDIIVNHASQRAQASGFNITMPTDGGIMVQMDFSMELLKSSQEEALFWGKGKHLPLSAGSLGIDLPYVIDKDKSSGSVTGGLKWYSTSEAQAATRSQFKMDSYTLKLKQFGAGCYVTDQIIRNAGVLVALIKDSFRYELSAKLDDMILNGNGNDQFTGILTTGNKALLVIAKEAGQTNGTIVTANVDKMDTFVKGDAQWYVSRTMRQKLNGLKFDEASSVPIPVFTPANSIAGAKHGQMYARNVIKTDLITATIGAQGDIALIDPKEYLTIDQGDVDFQASVHVRFWEGEQAMKFTYWADGKPSYYDKEKGRNGETISPYVVLQAR